ncbi:MAG: hypothetical protein JST92_22825 [Deltaproteobacteria bacterium]|nr:hypothetical protein [Deltaproteobacteria bacterium]
MTRGPLAIALITFAIAGAARAQGAGTSTIPGASASSSTPSVIAAPSPEDQREARFTELLRTYPERLPAVTLGMVARLLDEGPFAEHDRALYWLGSANQALGERALALQWYARLAKEHPDSIWVERSYLGQADLAAQQRHFGTALEFHARAEKSRDPAVRELARLASMQVHTLQNRQRAAWACQLFAALVALFLLRSAWRARGLSALWPLPTEARILLPVLLVIGLLAFRQDPAPRFAIYEASFGGFVLAWLSGARLSSVKLSRAQRLLHGLLVVVTFAGLAYTAVWRSDLVGMVLETIRAGPE